MKNTRIAAAAAVLAAGAAIGLAGPANAEWTDGTYTTTITDATAVLKVGATVTKVVTSCGPACKVVTNSEGSTMEMHLDGNTWSPGGLDDGQVHTIDNNSLIETVVYPELSVVAHVQWAKIS